jgi:hypothetical protein
MVLSENQKIGVGLIALGAFFVFLGVVLFLDAGLIAIGASLRLYMYTYIITYMHKYIAYI